MVKKRVLIIDDQPDVGVALSVLFKLNQLEPLVALSPEQSLQILANEHIDIVVQDMNFSADTTSGREGITLFRQLRQTYANLPIILMTGWTELETAVSLMREGAADYIAKPWDEDKLLARVQGLLTIGSAKQATANKAPSDKLAELKAKFDLCGYEFNSQAMQALLALTTKVAKVNVPLLITGPNGAGKECIAHIAQANSHCHSGPFVKVNVGALPSELMEAELFGAEEGAYTGLKKRRIGRFEQAHQGTLFLDEIGNLSLEGQAKLLRVLETGEFERLGSGETISVTVRLITATNADLKAMIAEGRFREDLYYRLNLIELALPALKERKEDILALAQYFMHQQQVELYGESSASLRLSGCAEHKLLQYDWPGNVRELKNVITRACLLCTDDEIVAADLNIEVAEESTVVADELSEQDISAALESNQGVLSNAAKTLGISRSALYRRMKKLGMS
ncbi:sigma-54-dependent transcriptional regulator [Pseudoalteromonas fenneropenaei]|uniref:Sigma-54-dependent transcriptional regulator n=1 Tax=Pseudoalteromonas fenneropenaei TaxID=1737459 RepID=A0ABV7CDC2_9GAMM